MKASRSYETSGTTRPMTTVSHHRKFESSKYQQFKLQSIVFFFQRRHIPEWDMTCSMTLRRYSLDCALILQFLHPTSATPSNTSHHLNFCLPFVLRRLLTLRTTSTFVCLLFYLQFPLVNTKDLPYKVTFLHPHHVFSQIKYINNFQLLKKENIAHKSKYILAHADMKTERILRRCCHIFLTLAESVVP
jgi:hypothetical protein